MGEEQREGVMEKECFLDYHKPKRGTLQRLPSECDAHDYDDSGAD